MPLEILHSSEEWASRFGDRRTSAVVTIGNFDGVHLGHQKILRCVEEKARRTGSLSAVLTFYPHPARVLRPEHAPSLLLTIQQRLAAFEAIGIAATMVLQFDSALAQVSAEDFVRRFLVQAMRAGVVLVGQNFRFGHRQAGDVKLLEQFGKAYGFSVESVEPVVKDGFVVSSSVIRRELAEGHVAEARKMLGRAFCLAGEIQPGTGMGRKLVVPTLNLKTPQEMLPKNGVYATKVVVGGKAYGAVTNVGVRPTFNGSHLTVESHLFDFSEIVTEGPMEVRFWERLREERRFANPEELRNQVLNDIREGKNYFTELGESEKRSEEVRFDSQAEPG